MEPNEYLKMAEVEDRMWYYQSLHAHIGRELAAARLRDGAAILDAGCGTGGLIVRAARWPLRAQWTGIDFMAIACELARRRCGAGVDIREASITALPFADGTFDAITSADVLCQVNNAAEGVAEFARVLRPGGVAVINVPAYMWMWSYHDDAVHSQHRFTRREVATLFAQAGFAVERLTHWNALPFPLVWAKRKLFRTARDTSDVKTYPAPVETMFRGVMAIEHAWLRRGGNWAWGTSVLAVGRKP